LSRIRKVLKDSQWGGLGSHLGKRKRGEDGVRGVKRYTREQLGSVIQASEGELERGLKESNVVEVNG
jgi:sister chromatid cohesion protein DCC1